MPHILRSFCLIALMLLTASLSLQAQSRRERKAYALYEAGEYYAAVDKLKKLYSKTKNRDKKAEISYMMGESYRRLNMPARAYGSYRRAISYKYEKTDAIYYAAQCLKMMEKYRDASKLYKEYAELVPDDPRGQIGVESCQMISEWKKNPSPFIVEKKRELNSRESDFCPVYARSDYRTVYFTSSREAAAGDKTNNHSGMGFTDIFVITQDRRGKWSEAVPLEGINTEFDEGAPNLDRNKVTLYFTRCVMEKTGNYGCKIFSAQSNSGKWSDPTEIPIVEDSSITVGHPAISADDLTLYFVSNMEGGLGGSDIWKVTRKKRTGEWREPENVGAPINTPGDEKFPYVREDGTLYFSSDYHAGMGGLDIFMANETDSGTFIENMGVPINSHADDFGITFQGDNNAGFFSSSRQGRGGDDIYYFFEPALEFFMEGIVRNEDTGTPIPAAKVIITGSNGTQYEQKTNRKGEFKFDLKPETDYTLASFKEGFLNGNGFETTKGLDQNKTLYVEMTMLYLPEDTAIEVPDIFYAYDDSTLLDESTVALDQLVELLEANESITIELMAHTDARGDEKYNQRLSQGRANTVLRYLVDEGIQEKRLVAKGYGESTPKTIGETFAKRYDFLKKGDVLTEEFINKLPKEQQETAHRLNRRTEFKVLSVDYDANSEGDK